MLRPGERVRINKPTGTESSRHGQVGEVVECEAEKPERAVWVKLAGESGPRWYYLEELEEVA